MPTYEYECKKCGYSFDKFQKITDPACTNCLKCNGQLVKIIGTGAGIIFKGSGFYATDYRSASYREKVKKENTCSNDKKDSKKNSKKEND